MAGAVDQMTLRRYVQVAGRLGRKAFLRRYREPVIVAMGVLETEEIQARSGATVGLRMAAPMTYDRKEVHPLAGRIFTLPIESWPTGTWIMGRDEPADVIVPDGTVSIHHCSLTWDGTKVTVADLGSTNGTFINLKLIRPGRPGRLRNEDILTVGRHSFQYYLPSHLYRVLEGLASPDGF